jgi:hypothetical protein
MREQLEKAILLAKKTGDRLIIFDTSSALAPFVVMSIEEYEKLILGKSEVRNLTEDQLLDKINRDIAIWKSEQELAHWPADSARIIEDFNPLNIKEDGENKWEDRPKKKQRWSIPRDRLDGAEEVIEEDRQYLQPINF